MRIDPMPVGISLAVLLPVALAFFSARRRLVRDFALVLGTLALLDLIANLSGLGAVLWWSPIHWPSAIALGIDEIVETHGATVSTVGYIADLVLWAAIITPMLGILRSKQATGKTLKATPEPVPNAASPGP